MVKNKINISELFTNLQEEMLSSLGVLKLTHAPTLGDYTELNWLNLFKDYLPRRYMADKAFVVDSQGNRSDAIDIVVYDSLYSPFLLNKNGVKFVPAESVYAVFEIKQDISKEHIKYAAYKASSVRDLIRTSVKINNAGIIQSPKPHFEIIAGLLATRNSWTQRSNGIKNSKKHISSFVDNQKLNLACCLEIGNFKNIGSKSIACSKKNAALITFFYELVSLLQDNGTVPAMDISAYLKNI